MAPIRLPQNHAVAELLTQTHLISLCTLIALYLTWWILFCTLPNWIERKCGKYSVRAVCGKIFCTIFCLFLWAYCLVPWMLRTSFEIQTPSFPDSYARQQHEKAYNSFGEYLIANHDQVITAIDDGGLKESSEDEQNQFLLDLFDKFLEERPGHKFDFDFV